MPTIQMRRIVIGDVHGELAGLKEILLHSGLIDEQGSWIGRESVLIQVGDVIDRGPYSRECIKLLRDLQTRATQIGIIGHRLPAFRY